MLTPATQRRLFAQAQALAERLAEGGVTRAELRYVLNPLFLPPEPWTNRLGAARRLLDALPTSWVGERTKQTRGRLLRVQGVLREILREDSREEELRYLLGWTARLVHIRDVEAKNRAEHGRPDERRRDPRRPPDARRP